MNYELSHFTFDLRRLNFTVITFLQPPLKLHLVATFWPVKLVLGWLEVVMNVISDLSLQTYNTELCLGMSTDLFVISSLCWATHQRNFTPWWTSSRLLRKKMNIDHCWIFH